MEKIDTHIFHIEQGKQTELSTDFLHNDVRDKKSQLYLYYEFQSIQRYHGDFCC